MSLSPTQADQADATLETQAATAADGEKQIQGRSPMQLAWARLRRDKISMVAGIVSVIVVVLAVIAPLLQHLGITSTKNHDELVQDLGSMPSGAMGGISSSHWLGVQPGSGSDLLSLILAGMTTSLEVALLATAISMVLGTIMGLIAGFSGGIVDWIISRVVDLILSFPQTLMLISLQAVMLGIIAKAMHLGDADPNVKITFMVVVLGFFGWPYFARIIRGQVMSLREREFIEAARSLGARSGRIYAKELLPHLWASILVFTTMVLPQNIAAEAALGYLGVGVNPPRISLGTLLNDSVTYALPDPAYFLFPGLTVFLMVLALNLFGDGLRDALDPKAGRQ